MSRAKVNGAELYYEESGSGSPIILCPGGLNGVMEHYRPIIGDLSQEHRVVAYDRRFGGQSRSPMVVQTWDLVCGDVIGLMDALGIDQAYLGGGSFGPGIAMGCAYRYPDRVRAVFLSNIAGGIFCDSWLAAKLLRGLEMASDQGMKAVVAANNKDDRYAPFVTDQVLYDPEFKAEMEAMDPEDYAQVMRDSIRALFEGPYVSCGMTKSMLKAIGTPSLVMPGHDDVHPREVAEQVHRLIPNSQWAEVRPHVEEPEKHVKRVLKFLSEVEAVAN
jgi:pimeloyl-ACP methyl ester carboxylesterase